MTFLFILAMNIGTVTAGGMTEAECRFAVLYAPVAVSEYGPETRLESASCEREV
jgi:hypothetical protein